MNTIQSFSEIKGQTITLDFNKNNYVSVTVKQFDENSRKINIKCANSGQILKLDKNLKLEIKVQTPDGRHILDDSCTSITSEGFILFNPSNDMLAKSGKAITELRIYDLESEGRISPMNFYMVVIASPYDEDRILNSEEFKSLVDLYVQASVDYEYVITEAQTYANLASESEQNAAKSALSADKDALIATTKAQEALQSANTAITKSEESSVSASNALTSEQNAKVSENNSKASETIATTMADLAKSYAIGTNGSIRLGDGTDNSKYYYELTKRHALAVGGIIYMGTITFAELSLVENQEANYMFNISDDFRTDDTFNVGAGIKYSAGTNVCRTADGFWDIFVGINSFGTGEVITESEYDEPTDQTEGEYWIFEY